MENIKPLVFRDELIQKVNAYFKKTKLRRNSGGARIWIVTLTGLFFYIAPYVALINGHLSYVPNLILAIGSMTLGFVMLGSTQHHASHQSFSPSKRINNLFRKVLDLLWINSDNWSIQHVILHHLNTNIYGKDYDLDSGGIFVAFSKFAKRYKLHRVQHIFALFYYSFTFLLWIFFGDFKRVVQYYKWGHFKESGKSLWVHILYVFLRKAVMFFIFFGIPTLIGIPFGITATLWFVAIFGAGFFMTPIFEVAHINEWAHQYKDMPTPSGAAAWEHQVKTSTSFYWGNPKSIVDRILTDVYGGLNYQIEHHLFPAISYVHYPALQDIVKETAEECGIEYHCYGFSRILKSHIQTLKVIAQEKAEIA